MRTVCCRGCLSCHACHLPCTPHCHAHTPATHAPLPCMPPATHAPCHACPPAMHVSPAMHTPPTTHTPYNACPPAMHAPMPCMPSPLNRITDRCRNIIFPQLLLRTVKTSVPLLAHNTKLNKLAAATAQTRPSNGVPVADLGGYQVGEKPIVLRQLLLW